MFRNCSTMKHFICILLLLFNSSSSVISIFLNNSRIIRAAEEFIKSKQDASYTNVVIVRQDFFKLFSRTKPSLKSLSGTSQLLAQSLSINSKNKWQQPISTGKNCGLYIFNSTFNWLAFLIFYHSIFRTAIMKRFCQMCFCCAIKSYVLLKSVLCRITNSFYLVFDPPNCAIYK